MVDEWSDYSAFVAFSSFSASLSDIVSLWREFTGHGYGDSEPLVRAEFIDYLMKK